MCPGEGTLAPSLAGASSAPGLALREQVCDSGLLECHVTSNCGGKLTVACCYWLYLHVSFPTLSVPAIPAFRPHASEFTLESNYYFMHMHYFMYMHYYMYMHIFHRTAHL